MLGSDGQKMSKSLRNYPDVREVFDRDGADAMRWFLMSSPILRGGNLIVTEQAIREGVRQVLIPLWNCWYFFALYANAVPAVRRAALHGVRRTRWTATCWPRPASTSRPSTRQMDDYEVAERLRHHARRSSTCCRTGTSAAPASGSGPPTRRAPTTDGASTPSTPSLEIVCRVAAPLLPLTTEEVWRGLTGGRSVHLTDWPSVDDLPADDELVAAMDQVREVCSAGSALRKAAALRERLPLPTLTVVVAGADRLAGFEDIVADELNVKSVRLLDAGHPDAASYGVSQRLTVNARAAGPRLGPSDSRLLARPRAGGSERP